MSYHFKTNNMKTPINFIILVALLTACNKEQPEPETINYYEARVIIKYNMPEIFDYYGIGRIKYIVDHEEGFCEKVNNGHGGADTITVYPISNRIYYKILFQYINPVSDVEEFGKVQKGTMEIIDSVITINCDESYFEIENCGGLGFIEFTQKNIPEEYIYDADQGQYINWSFVYDTISFEDATANYIPKCRPTTEFEKTWSIQLRDPSKDCYFIVGRTSSVFHCTPYRILYKEKVETDYCKITEYTYKQ